MSESVEQRVVRVIAAAKNLDPQAISVNTTLEELGLDSLDAMSVIFDLEGEFDIEIPDEDAEKARTVGDLVQGVGRLLRGGGAGA